MRALDEFYLNLIEPNKGCFLALKHVILSVNNEITEEWKYRLPFFYYKGKMLCYLWMDKKTKEPYIGLVQGNRIDHPELIKGDRKRMKILPINPNKNIKVKLIKELIQQSLTYYK